MHLSFFERVGIPRSTYNTRGSHFRLCKMAALEEYFCKSGPSRSSNCFTITIRCSTPFEKNKRLQKLSNSTKFSRMDLLDHCRAIFCMLMKATHVSNFNTLMQIRLHCFLNPISLKTDRIYDKKLFQPTV